jgi:hypothetical protein
VAPYKDVYNEMQKKAKQPKVTSFFTKSRLPLRLALCVVLSPKQLSPRNADIMPINANTNVVILLIINIIVFCVFGFP